MFSRNKSRSKSAGGFHPDIFRLATNRRKFPADSPKYVSCAGWRCRKVPSLRWLAEAIDDRLLLGRAQSQPRQRDYDRVNLSSTEVRGKGRRGYPIGRENDQPVQGSSEDTSPAIVSYMLSTMLRTEAIDESPRRGRYLTQ